MFSSVGVIGYGAFGKLLVKELKTRFENIVVHDQDNAQTSSLEDVAACDLIFLAVPVQSFEELLPKLNEHINEKTTVVDVSSVKLEPIRLMQEFLPKATTVIGSHPIFGPQTESDERLVVVCDVIGDSEPLRNLYEKLSWQVKQMSADDHDKDMAVVHGLTFFVAQGLLDMGLAQPILPTGFYSHLQKLMDMQAQHTDALTETIEKYNPYAAEAREQLLAELTKLDNEYSN